MNREIYPCRAERSVFGVWEFICRILLIVVLKVYWPYGVIGEGWVGFWAENEYLYKHHWLSAPVFSLCVGFFRALSPGSYPVLSIQPRSLQPTDYSQINICQALTREPSARSQGRGVMTARMQTRQFIDRPPTQ